MPDGYYDISWKIDGDGYIQHADGAVASSSVSSHTDYIDISRFDSIAYKRQKTTIANPTAGIAFYDSNKTYKSPGIPSLGNQSSAGYVSTLNVVSVPSGAVYVRCSTYTDTATYGDFEIYGVIGGKTYAVSQANIMSIGDAVRAKGNTVASLSFPDGIVSAIGAIPAMTLLAEQSLGTISTSSTTSTDTGLTVSVPGVNAYDGVLMMTSVDSVTNGRHACTCRWIWMTASSNISTKDSFATATATYNIKISSDGVATARSNTTAYGIYNSGSSLNNGVLTLGIYTRYNSTQTGTINGSYTTRVYGFKIYDLIGG